MEENSLISVPCPEETLEALVERYERPGPRYTSYPTAVQFSEDFTGEDYHRCLQTAASLKGEPLTIYIHVPFCEHRCLYCGCNVVPTLKRSVAEDYLVHLTREIRILSDFFKGERPVKVLHIGGGTPTYLTCEQLERLVRRLFSSFPRADSPELSIEIDPRVTGAAHLACLRREGFNRISLGVQDFSPAVQEAIGRHQTVEQTVATYSRARRLGFESINFDLVYGLPGQTPETLTATLDQVVRMRPDRIAFYGYAHVPWMRSNQRRLDASQLPTGKSKLELFLQGHCALLAGGYRQVGMDHFALPDDELVTAQESGRLGRNFMGYTPHSDLEILGLGCSSIGSLSGAYIQNFKKLATYRRALAARVLPVERGVKCSRDDEVRRWVIHQILCNLRVESSRFDALFGRPLWSYFPSEREGLTPFLRDGLVTATEDGLAVTPLGRILVRNVAMVFDRYLNEARNPEDNQYSRTV